MTLERGIQSLMNQYRHDFYRMHDTITANIASLRTIIDQSATTIFPEREKFIQLANSLESKIMTHNSDRDETLEELVALSHQYVLDASYSFEQTKKTLVLQDITSLENEIIYLDSIFRVTSGTVLIFDTQIFNALFQKSFSPKEL